MRNKLYNFLLKRFFNAVTDKDILKINKRGEIRVGEHLLPEEDVRAVVEQANTIHQMMLWSFLSKDLKYRANEAMYNKSQTIEDMIMGKALLFADDIITQRIEQLSRMK